ncbi:uncharacterized protein BX663DRAFT_552310 [Cokeromyces recurvatus]|uniref:uncharacterized protein n=1 Tax=Cokeromyces recurvatus TaxID=90255 RepID=UPI0022211D81|nr:uncharacterized protein BX663DRAFT_552310 [Cokeromyces recurvatus]KAI7902387.1 hypothetical protein BX663DRAFT_552310 [Cokeromyces recurvatus]
MPASKNTKSISRQELWRKKVLGPYYGNETQQTKQNYFHNHYFDFHKTPDEPTSLSIYAGYLELMLQQKHISVRLSHSDKTKLLCIVAEMSRGEQENLKQQASKLLEQLQVLPFRKIKFSSKLFYDQDDLALNDFKVYLVDEFHTSSFCPNYENRLEKFKLIANPRPFQREKMPTVFCHGLLHCENIHCLNEHEYKRRIWNRDLVATLNFKKILTSLRNNGEKHLLFSRQKQQQQF